MLGLRAHPALGSFLAGRFVLATQDTGAFIPHLSCRFFYTRQSLPPLHNFPFRDYKQSPHSWTFENELSTQEGGSLWRPAVSILSPPPPAKGSSGRQKFKAHLVEYFCLREGPREALVLRVMGQRRQVGISPPRLSPVHRTHHPVTVTQIMMEVAASHLFCPMTTLAWRSSLSCVVFGLWALLPSVWPTRLVCIWDWEGAGFKKKGKRTRRSHAAWWWWWGLWLERSLHKETQRRNLMWW